jgi:ribosomal protein RSM22 (predicted rRNA methylase)
LCLINLVHCPIRADADKQQEGGKYRTFNDAQASAVQVNVPPLTYNKQQSMAYVAHRVPGIFGCNVRVFEEIKSRMPDFKPKKMLDFGSGPGTTTWAASTVWDSIKRYVLVEPSEHMQEVSAKMLKDFPVERRRHMNTGRLNDIDLIVASYSLSEMDSDATRRGQVREMWENLVPGGILVRFCVAFVSVRNDEHLNMC